MHTLSAFPELNTMSKHCNPLQKFSEKHDFKIQFNVASVCDFRFVRCRNVHLLQWLPAYTLKGSEKTSSEIWRRRLGAACHVLCNANAFMQYQAIHSSSVQLTPTPHYTQPPYVLFVLIYPAANNTSLISSFCLEMFLNPILKSAIMKHYVLVSIPLTNLRTLFELRKEVGLKANRGQC